MISHLGRYLFLGTLLVTLIAGLFVVATKRPGPTSDKSDILTASNQATPAPTFSVVLLKTDDEKKRLISCQQQHCQILTPPSSQKSSAVTDSRSWYYYQDGSLRRTWIENNQSDVIVDQTPLVRPRDIIISPDNKKVTYWLDNVDQPDKQLTELWAFDSDEGGTKLLAEKLVRPAVVTKARWNKASSRLWFVGDDYELNVVSTQPPGIVSSFKNLNWEQLKNVADHGVMDISLAGKALAYAEPTYLGRSKLVTVSAGERPRTVIARYQIPYLQWLDDDSLLFVTQDSQNFTFWRLNGLTQQQIVRHPGQLESVRIEGESNYAIFASQPRKNQTRLYALNIKSGDVINLNYQVPSFGKHTYLVHVESPPDQSGQVAGLTQPLADDQLAAFVENNLADMVRQTNVRPKRLVITDKPNTIYVDYRDGTSVDKRLLLTVNDAVYAEWSISAYYEEVSGEWVKTEGAGLAEPTARRLYEWEENLDQWILKENYQ